MRGHLHNLRELWKKEKYDGDVKSTYQYMVDLRDRLEKYYEIAHSNAVNVYRRCTKLYNRNAKCFRLQCDQKDLELIPQNSNKSLLQWHGHYTVMEKVGALDLRITMAFNIIKAFHANMIKNYIAISRQ